MTDKRIVFLGGGGSIGIDRSLAIKMTEELVKHPLIQPTSNEDWKSNLKRHNKKGKMRNVK